MLEVVDYISGNPSLGLCNLQKIEKDILSIFLDFCKTHDLHPFLVAGSALGAARHGDIIPWDDDIDVGLLRDEFESFIELTLNNPLPGVFCQSYRSERNYPHAYAKLRYENSAVHEAAFEGAQIRDGIFIDVFPFDYLPASQVTRAGQHALLAMFNLVIMSFSRHTTTVSGSAPLRILRRLAYTLRPVLPWRRMITWRERVSNPRWLNRSKEVISFEMYGIRHAKRTAVDVNCIMPLGYRPFGELNAPVPGDLDRYLTLLFGNYRQFPPEDERKPVHVSAVDTPDP